MCDNLCRWYREFRLGKQLNCESGKGVNINTWSFCSFIYFAVISGGGKEFDLCNAEINVTNRKFLDSFICLEWKQKDERAGKLKDLFAKHKKK